MNAISKARNSIYFVFLQPTYGLDMDKAALISLNKEREIQAGSQLVRNKYLLRFNSLYSMLRR